MLYLNPNAPYTTEFAIPLFELAMFPTLAILLSWTCQLTFAERTFPERQLQTFAYPHIRGARVEQSG